MTNRKNEKLLTDSIQKKEYDLIIIGTGSAMNVVEPMMQENPKIKIAVIDKDEPGGICLTRGCIPSKLMLYPAELVRIIEKAKELGVSAKIEKIEFAKIMQRMRSFIGKDISSIRNGLSNSENIDYYRTQAEFVAPYTLRVSRGDNHNKEGDDSGAKTATNIMTSKMIILGTGSRTIIPKIDGLEETGYLTSDTLLALKQLPRSIAIIGGGYIAAEYGHFFSGMGSKVTIIGRNPQFLPEEEPEVSYVAKQELGKFLEIYAGFEVDQVSKKNGKKKLTAFNKSSQKRIEIEADEILVAAGRGPTNDILHPERAGITLDERGWIKVDEYLETSQPNIWALGDGIRRYPFKHMANYESQILYYNAVLKKKVKADYHAVPHAVFTYPEIASVGIKEEEAVERYGKDKVLIGFYKFKDVAKGGAMGIEENYFVKVLVEKETNQILGAHIVGPYASILIHEIINLMYTHEQSAYSAIRAVHIHPALNEVVQRAFQSLSDIDCYHKMVDEEFRLSNNMM